MISVHFTIYTDELGQDRFKATTPDPTDPELMHDVTDQYMLVATATEDGRPGFAFFKVDVPHEARHPTGVEL